MSRTRRTPRTRQTSRTTDAPRTPNTSRTRRPDGERTPWAPTVLGGAVGGAVRAVIGWLLERFSG
ncbi:hypothetical protein [Streptomyces sp. NPDC048606]|uniref:hypothetical protein n=1 Tax=Streptomyces sp. NPDC048606 TaxID=3154726 RepID=UPI00342BDFC8